MAEKKISTNVVPAVEKVKVATDFIRGSALCTEGRYLWLKPLIEKVLNDSFNLADIKATVDKISPSPESELLPEQEITSPPSCEVKGDGDANQGILTLARIKSIDLINNFGLLSRSKPIELNESLNIFYGQNASGKSSLYLALCKALGKSNKKVIPNINKQDENASCTLKYLDAEGKENELCWRLGIDNITLPAMVFDNTICNYLVEDDQENHFKLAHLKTQYFKFLQQSYIKIEEELNRRSKGLKDKLEGIEAVLKVKVPHLFCPVFTLTRESIEKASFSEEEENRLSSLTRDIETASNKTGAAVLKNLQNGVSKIEEILSKFAVKNVSESKEITWTSKFNSTYFEIIDSKIRTYNERKNMLEREGDISKYINADWIKNELWLEFINKSISFMNTLTDTEKVKYQEKACLYCHQPLISKEAKSIIQAYKKIQEAQKKSAQNELKDIQNAASHIEACVDILNDGIESINIIIEQEFEQVRGRAEKISINKQSLMDVLN
ncbi:MAG: AAA family ATPase [Candidatus Omnitrophica bacterium]|nr:AAA family ATPase [Candidatus Omnitrophota bacterium]MDD5737745.1 AAA family ATPase [Candidatus Omnitrophota bacterium]